MATISECLKSCDSSSSDSSSRPAELRYLPNDFHGMVVRCRITCDRIYSSSLSVDSSGRTEGETRVNETTEKATGVCSLLF